MNDKQTDIIREIETIAELMQNFKEEEMIDGDTIQIIGNMIIQKCKNILYS